MLSLDGVSAGYGAIDVVHDVSLAVPDGQITALLGPNGAGKTTLLQAAAGTLGRVRGDVRVNGSDVSSLPPHDRVASGLCLIPQGRGVFAGLTVAENLRLFAGRALDSTAWDVIGEIFPVLTDRQRQRAGTLSGGEQQMLALSRAFLTEPVAVMADELSEGLAPLIIDDIFDALDLLRRAGTSVLLVEQFAERALALATDVYVLAQGVIVHQGSAGDLKSQDLLDLYLTADETVTDTGGTPMENRS